MRSSTRYSVSLITLVVPAIMALWFAQHVIETFFPDVTLMDLGAFCALGLVAGLTSGIRWGRCRGTEGQG